MKARSKTRTRKTSNSRIGRTGRVLAAVDLGSNSFHMVVARQTGGQLVIIDRLREMIRLGEGVDANGQLDARVTARALACLERFGQRLAHMRARSVRVVGTSALRRIKQRRAFLEKARKAIGHPIDVISGREEARLIYAGVNRTLPRTTDRRLVIDIGGGSTEVIIGQGHDPIALASLKMGCVTMSKDYFDEGKLSLRRFERARLAARQEIDPIRLEFRKRGWATAAGSSGTIRALHDVLQEIDPRSAAINRDGLEELVGQFIAAGNVSKLPFTSLGTERRPVIAGGLAILVELVAQLGINQMRVADGAMREGVLYDLVGRLTAEDARDQTVRSMQARYHVDMAQAARVEASAVALWKQIRPLRPVSSPLAELFLRWAAQLHEIGLDVAHSGYHRHGAYLLENAEMPGFARDEQLLLARLVRLHRRRLELRDLADLAPPWDRIAGRLVAALRLAVLLHRNRGGISPPRVTLSMRGRVITAKFRLRSLRRHPLTQADLHSEHGLLKASGLTLRIGLG